MTPTHPPLVPALGPDSRPVRWPPGPCWRGRAAGTRCRLRRRPIWRWPWRQWWSGPSSSPARRRRCGATGRACWRGIPRPWWTCRVRFRGRRSACAAAGGAAALHQPAAGAHHGALARPKCQTLPTAHPRHAVDPGATQSRVPVLNAHRGRGFHPPGHGGPGRLHGPGRAVLGGGEAPTAWRDLPLVRGGEGGRGGGGGGGGGGRIRGGGGGGGGGGAWGSGGRARGRCSGSHFTGAKPEPLKNQGAGIGRAASHGRSITWCSSAWWAATRTRASLPTMPPCGGSSSTDGWLDTVLVMPFERVRIRSTFLDYPGLYLYHCHMLEDEDMGMMRNFRVVA